MFVAVGHNGLRISSADGATWKNQELGKEGEVHRAVAFGGGRFSAVGTFGYGESVFAMAPTDAAKWESKVKGKDGLGWEDAVPIDGKYMRRRMVFGNNMWVGVGDRGRIAASADGKKWTDAPDTKPLDTLVDVAFGNGVFVGVGLQGLRRSSADGKKWTEPVRGQEGEHLNSVIFTGKEFVAIGAGATYLSPNGKDWKRAPNKNAPTFATIGAGIFVGTSWRGRLLRSADGVDWKDVHKVEHPIEAVAFGA